MTCAIFMYAWLFMLAGVVTPIAPLKGRCINLLFILDCALFSICTLGTSYPYESFSSAAWRSQGMGGLYGRIARPSIDWFFLRVLGQHEHCANAFFYAKLNLPPEQR